MPRVVRNFWLELDLDAGSKGRRRVASGPTGTDGGFDLTIRIREKGVVGDRPVRLIGRAVDGKCTIVAEHEKRYITLASVER